MTDSKYITISDIAHEQLKNADDMQIERIFQEFYKMGYEAGMREADNSEMDKFIEEWTSLLRKCEKCPAWCLSRAKAFWKCMGTGEGRNNYELHSRIHRRRNV